jgi:hypothetical protein
MFGELNIPSQKIGSLQLGHQNKMAIFWKNFKDFVHISVIYGTSALDTKIA